MLSANFSEFAPNNNTMPFSTFLLLPLLMMLASSSFLTRAHNALRLRWMLKDGGSDAVYGFLTELGEVAGSREERKAILAAIRDGKYAPAEKLSEKERGVAMEAAITSGLPPGRLACTLMVGKSTCGRAATGN